MKYLFPLLLSLSAVAQPVYEKNFYVLKVLEQTPPRHPRLTEIAAAKRKSVN